MPPTGDGATWGSLCVPRSMECGRGGVHLSMLYPFYRRYGWELATEAISYRLELTDLPIRSGNKRVRAYQNEDLQPMMALLEGESSRHPLCVRRSEAHWRTAGTGEHGGGRLRGGRAGRGLLTL